MFFQKIRELVLRDEPVVVLVDRVKCLRNAEKRSFSLTLASALSRVLNANVKSQHMCEVILSSEREHLAAWHTFAMRVARSQHSSIGQVLGRESVRELGEAEPAVTVVVIAVKKKLDLLVGSIHSVQRESFLKFESAQEAYVV